MTPALIERLAAVPEVWADMRPWCLSPDGRTLAFTWRRDGDWHVYLVDLEGGEPRRVEPFDDACLCPLFSPDGAFLYFARDDRGTECYDIYRYHLANGSLVNLLPDTPTLSPAPDFALSPDGRTLALSVNHGPSQTAAVMPVDGGPAGLRLLTAHWSNDWSPSFSPDGRLVAFATDTHGQDSAVLITDLEGGAPRAIGGETMLQARDPAWSPDGRLLAFSGGPGDYEALGVFDLAAGDARWVWQGRGNAHAPGLVARRTRARVRRRRRSRERALPPRDRARRRAHASTSAPATTTAPGFTARRRRPDRATAVPAARPISTSSTSARATPVGSPTRCRPICATTPSSRASRPSGSRAATSWPRCRACSARRRDRAAPASSSSTAAPPGTTPTSGTPCARRSWPPAAHVVHPNYRGSDGYGRRWQLANRSCSARARPRTAPAPSLSSSPGAATPRASPSPAAATAAT